MDNMEELTHIAKEIDEEWLRRMRVRREAVMESFQALQAAMRDAAKVINELSRALEELSDESLEESED